MNHIPGTFEVRYINALLCFIYLFLFAGCVSFKRPEGEWLHPAHLRVNPMLMKDAKIGVTCGFGSMNRQDWSTISTSQSCDGLKDLIKEMGANVVDVNSLGPDSGEPGIIEGQSSSSDGGGEDDEESTDGAADQRPIKPDFTIAYVSRDSERDFCWGTLPFFVLSLTLFPCIEDLFVGAEIRIFDQDGLELQEKSFRGTERHIYGIPALYFLARKALFSEEYNKLNEDLEKRFVSYLTDTIYTFRIRQMVTSGGTQTPKGGIL